MKDYQIINLSHLTTSETGLLQGRAYRNLNREFAAFLGEFDLSLTDWALLGIVAGRSGVSQVELAEELDVTAPMAAKIVAALEQAGFVTREPSLTDSRVKIVSLAPAGAGCIAKVEPVLRKRMSLLMADISRADLEAYIRVLVSLAHRNQ